jgi:hypothetical protein
MLEGVAAVERPGHAAMGAAHQHQRSHAPRRASVSLERDLYTHRVPNVHGVFDTGRVQHRDGICGKGRYVDAAVVAWRSAATVASVVPMQDGVRA